MKVAKNVFGYQIIQKLLSCGSFEESQNLFKQLLGHIYELSFHTFGSRVIQIALSMSSFNSQSAWCLEIVKELEENLLECILDINGNHVIRSCLEHIPVIHLQSIINVCVIQVTIRNKSYFL